MHSALYKYTTLYIKELTSIQNVTWPHNLLPTLSPTQSTPNKLYSELHKFLATSQSKTIKTWGHPLVTSQVDSTTRIIIVRRNLVDIAVPSSPIVHSQSMQCINLRVHLCNPTFPYRNGKIKEKVFVSDRPSSPTHSVPQNKNLKFTVIINWAAEIINPNQNQSNT